MLNRLTSKTFETLSEALLYSVYNIPFQSFHTLDKVEECEYEYPNKVNEVPVQSDLLDHFVVTTFFENTFNSH